MELQYKSTVCVCVCVGNRWAVFRCCGSLNTDEGQTGGWLASGLSVSLAASCSSANTSSAIMGSHITSLNWFDLFFIVSNPDYPRLPSPQPRSSHAVIKADRGRSVTITKDELEGECSLAILFGVLSVKDFECFTPVCRQWFYLTGREVHSTTSHRLLTKVNWKTVPGVILVNANSG